MSETGTLYFVVQTRMHRDSEGRVRADFGYARYEAWMPYLAAVGRVIILSRVSPVISDTGALVEGPGVSVMPVPFYHGPLDFARKAGTIRRFLARELSDTSALYGGRIPNVLAALVQQRARKIGAVFIAQMVGDPEDVLASGVVGRVGRIMARIARRTVARQVARADAVIYVTRETLQRKYPAGDKVPTLVRSNVELSPDSFEPVPRDYTDTTRGRSPVRLVAAGSHEQRYKGHHTLIDAVGLLKAQGVDVEATIIGDGRFHEELVERAHQQGVGDVVEFAGHLSGADLVREQILRADIFVMPSLTEGLPRALIEAMATGTVSIGSRVGGIPELLSEDALFDAGSADQLAATLRRLIEDPELMTTLSRRQWNEAQLISRSFSGTDILATFLRQLKNPAGEH
ncbi:MAG TPA: glycosyltransferase family 4 protein [Glaciibacter sp.]|nr:glycosyltransferase family 4 protein [Glaciibacter sp.]